MTYPIIHILADAADSPEFMGTKWKQWVLHENERWLFKEARATAGEDWSEKVASEIGKLIGIDVAEVELAQFGERRGCILRNFVHRDRGEVLWHGNEILAGNIKDYDKEKKLRQHQHNLRNIWLGLERAFQDAPRSIIDKMHRDMARRLVLDALIGNTDRHHENWGLLWYAEPQDRQRMLHLRMAPSFDHASSPARKVSVHARWQWLKKRLLTSRSIFGPFLPKCRRWT